MLDNAILCYIISLRRLQFLLIEFHTSSAEYLQPPASASLTLLLNIAHRPSTWTASALQEPPLPPRTTPPPRLRLDSGAGCPAARGLLGPLGFHQDRRRGLLPPTSLRGAQARPCGHVRALTRGVEQSEERCGRGGGFKRTGISNRSTKSNSNKAVCIMSGGTNKEHKHIVCFSLFQTSKRTLIDQSEIHSSKQVFQMDWWFD